MAASAIVKILSSLIMKHGLRHGPKLAKKLGFSSKQIKRALPKANKRVNKKIDKMAEEDVRWGRADEWIDGQTGPTHPIWGRQGIDW
tara:strand:- start:4825 stop:5085 length:261 start_codon:yes stop_codon:yes gene_type:complete